jgi:hypothetical protein
VLIVRPKAVSFDKSTRRGHHNAHTGCLLAHVIPEQLIKLAFAIECTQLIAASNVEVTDKYLRDGNPSVCLFDHLVAAFPIAANVDLCELNAFSLQQGFCGSAVWTVARRINENLFHCTIA